LLLYEKTWKQCVNEDTRQETRRMLLNEVRLNRRVGIF